MKKKQRGSIFFFTLSLLLLISLLLLASMQHLLLYQRATIRQEKEHHNVYQMEELMYQLINSQPHSSCMISKNKANEVFSLLQHQGCMLTVEQEHYRYLIEDLGEYPCGVVFYQGALHATHHFRFSIRSVEKNDFSDLVLQVRVIERSKKTTCSEVKHHSILGVASWRTVVIYTARDHKL